MFDLESTKQRYSGINGVGKVIEGTGRAAQQFMTTTKRIQEEREMEMLLSAHLFRVTFLTPIFVSSSGYLPGFRTIVI